MHWWSSEARWVSDENGLRWYFSEPNPGGPSRLECYRRLLGEPASVTERRSAATVFLTACAAPLRRWSDLVDGARRHWQDAPARPQVGQERAG